jgi:hypothetical protein
MDMLSERERDQFAEIESQLRCSDPRFVVKLDRINRRHMVPRRWFLRWAVRG